MLQTTSSASLAVKFAAEGHTTLIVSTDPAHSLSDALAQVPPVSYSCSCTSLPATLAQGPLREMHVPPPPPLPPLPDRHTTLIVSTDPIHSLSDAFAQLPPCLPHLLNHCPARRTCSGLSRLLRHIPDCHTCSCTSTSYALAWVPPCLPNPLRYRPGCHT